MQYLLTEEEYNALKSKQEFQLEVSKKKLQALCTKICNEMPIEVSWRKGEPKEPWGCIITETDTDSYDEWYCDCCPVQDICPYERKEWSK